MSPAGSGAQRRGPDRQPSPDQPGPAVRVKRPPGGRSGVGVGVQRRLRWTPHTADQLAVYQRPERHLLGDDQPDGQTLFAVNTGSGTISKYAIAPNGNLTLLSDTTVSAQAGVGAVDPVTSPDGRFLYVNESRSGTVAAFTTSGSAVTELQSSPVAVPHATAGTAGIAIR